MPNPSPMDRATLEQQHSLAIALLAVLEQQAAGYTSLTIPAHLKLQLDEKRQEVASLEARLAQLQGGGADDTVPDNLPRYCHIFVGRTEEMARCLAALAPEERGWGVTIDGIGGMGKTSLALEVAERARDAALFDAYLFASAKTSWLSPDGVRQETLAQSSLDAFCREFARILGQNEVVQISDAKARRQALLDVLRGRQALLIWDNLETLTAEEREQIAEFLRKLPAPNKAIITSRRRTGESAVTVRLDKLSFAEAANLMQQTGQRQPRVGRELQQAGEAGQGALYDAAGGIAEKLNNKQFQATFCGNLGQLALDRDRPQDARPWLERAIALAQEIGRQDEVARTLSRLAQVLESEGRYKEALDLARQALQIRERLRGRGVGFSRQQVARLETTNNEQ